MEKIRDHPKWFLIKDRLLKQDAAKTRPGHPFPGEAYTSTREVAEALNAVNAIIREDELNATPVWIIHPDVIKIAESDSQLDNEVFEAARNAGLPDDDEDDF